MKSVRIGLHIVSRWYFVFKSYREVSFVTFTVGLAKAENESRAVGLRTVYKVSIKNDRVRVKSLGKRGSSNKSLLFFF